MKTLAKIGSVVALGLTLVPALLVMSGTITLETNRSLMTAGAALWFVATPFWMRKSG